MLGMLSRERKSLPTTIAVHQLSLSTANGADTRPARIEDRCPGVHRFKQQTPALAIETKRQH